MKLGRRLGLGRDAPASALVSEPPAAAGERRRPLGPLGAHLGPTAPARSSLGLARGGAGIPPPRVRPEAGLRDRGGLSACAASPA